MRIVFPRRLSLMSIPRSAEPSSSKVKNIGGSPRREIYAGYARVQIRPASRNPRIQQYTNEPRGASYARASLSRAHVVHASNINAVRKREGVHALLHPQCCSYKVKALGVGVGLNILGSLTGGIWTDCVFVVLLIYM